VDLTNEDVADILAVLDSLPYDELDLQTPRFRLTLRRGPGGWTRESQVLADPVPVTPADHGPPAARQVPRPSEAGLPGADDGAGLVAVVAPLPGTFYRAPRPGADPFVQVGDAVAPDTVVAIVETMKLMNPVHAGTAGRVARISLENGDFAPLGTTLMLIEPGP